MSGDDLAKKTEKRIDDDLKKAAEAIANGTAIIGDPKKK